MNEFKILSIDELDNEFVTKLRVSVSVQPTDSLIPKMPEQNNNQIEFSSNELYEEALENNKIKILQ